MLLQLVVVVVMALLAAVAVAVAVAVGGGGGGAIHNATLGEPAASTCWPPGCRHAGPHGEGRSLPPGPEKQRGGVIIGPCAG